MDYSGTEYKHVRRVIEWTNECRNDVQDLKKQQDAASKSLRKAYAQHSKLEAWGTQMAELLGPSPTSPATLTTSQTQICHPPPTTMRRHKLLVF